MSTKKAAPASKKSNTDDGDIYTSVLSFSHSPIHETGEVDVVRVPTQVGSFDPPTLIPATANALSILLLSFPGRPPHLGVYASHAMIAPPSRFGHSLNPARGLQARQQLSVPLSFCLFCFPLSLVPATASLGKFEVLSSKLPSDLGYGCAVLLQR